MRILYFYQFFTTLSGSWSTRVYEFSKEWIAAGHSVTIITGTYDKSDVRSKKIIEKLEIEGIKVYVINAGLSNKQGVFRRVFSFLVYAVIATWFSLTLSADILIASSGPITVGVPALFAKWIRNKPLIFEVRDIWPEGAIQLGVLKNSFVVSISRWLESFCYDSASCIVVLSQGMKAWILAQQKKQYPIEIVTNFSSVDFFEANQSFDLPEFAKQKSVVLYAGSMGLMDSCFQILEAARKLKKRSDIIFVLLGDGAFRREIESRARESGLNNFYVLGNRPKKEVCGWLKNSCLALAVFNNVPVLNTVSPNKLFDAFAAGVPVIQTTQGWIKDLFDEKKCGISVSPDNAVEMSQAITTLVDNDNLRNEMALNAKLLGETDFSMKKLAKKYLDILQLVNEKWGAR